MYFEYFLKRDETSFVREDERLTVPLIAADAAMAP